MSPPKHIAVLAFPFGTHAAPLLSLARAISAALGPTAAISFFATARANRALFAGPDDRVTPRDVADGLPEGYAPSQRGPIEVVEIFLTSAPGNFRRALEAAEREVGVRVDCVLSDAFFWFAGEFAAERGAPWVALWTAAPRSLLVHLATDQIRQMSFGDREKTLDFLPGFSNIRVSDIPEGISSDKDSESPFATTLHKMGQTLPEATAVVINSFHGIDPEVSDHLKTRLKSFLNLGPFSLTMKPITESPANTTEDTHNCLEWLSYHEPASVVYVSFGSVATLPSHEVRAFAEALSETKFSFLWSFRVGAAESRPESFLSKSALDRGKIVPWAPQEEVLKHPSVGAFVTHCGWNSVVESVVGGVPMVCRPFFGDQSLNSRTVEAVWETGVEVGKGPEGVLTSQSVGEALRRVMLDDGEGEKGTMRERVCVLKRLAYEAVGNQEFEELVKLLI